VLIGKRRTINVEGYRMFDRVQVVCSEVDARTKRCFLVLFGGSLDFVSRGKPQTLCAIDLNRVMAIGSKDNKTVWMISVIGSARTIWKHFVRFGQNPCAGNGRRLCGGSEGRHAEKSEEREISDLHAANVAINQVPHNLILLNPSLSAVYVSRPCWQKCR